MITTCASRISTLLSVVSARNSSRVNPTSPNAVFHTSGSPRSAVPSPRSSHPMRVLCHRVRVLMRVATLMRNASSRHISRIPHTASSASVSSGLYTLSSTSHWSTTNATSSARYRSKGIRSTALHRGLASPARHPAARSRNTVSSSAPSRHTPLLARIAPQCRCHLSTSCSSVPVQPVAGLGRYAVTVNRSLIDEYVPSK